MFVFKKLFKTIVFLSRFLAITFLFFCLAQTTFAQVEITEIMYDLEGGDSGREWVELHNTGIESIDLYNWRFFEADSNHKIYIEKGGDVIGPGSYIEPNSYVILSNAVDIFMLDYPSYSEVVYYGSFSLHNTEEELIIRDAELNDIDSITYLSEWGANGDGNSLQKVNGSWCAGEPTPGAVNINICADLPDDDQPTSGDDEEYPLDNGSTQEQESFAAYSGTIPSWTKELKISTYAGARKRIVLAGADINFEGKSNGVDGKLLPYARHVWNFGDGSQGVGKEITHTYYYPGEYVVVLNTTSGEYTAMDRILVEVIPADILISNVSFDDPSFIEIYNKTSYELDLSRWQLKVGVWKFTIRQDTFIRPKKKIIFPSQVTKFSFKKGSEITLLYPSGDIVTSYYEEEENIPTPANKISNNTETTQPANDYVAEKVVIKNTTKNEASNNSSSQNIVKSKENSAQSYADINEGEETKPSFHEKSQSSLVASAKSYGEAKPASAGGYSEAKEKLINSNVSNTAQAANVLGGVEPRKENKKDGLFWGIIGVSLISLIAIYGVLISKEKKSPVSTGNEACLYKIIEIED